jgi:hypothetical protein
VSTSCVVELRTTMDVEAWHMREALIAVECDYDEANVASLHPKTRELVAMLKGKES